MFIYHQNPRFSGLPSRLIFFAGGEAPGQQPEKEAPKAEKQPEGFDFSGETIDLDLTIDVADDAKKEGAKKVQSRFIQMEPMTVTARTDKEKTRDARITELASSGGALKGITEAEKAGEGAVYEAVTPDKAQLARKMDDIKQGLDAADEILGIGQSKKDKMMAEIGQGLDDALGVLDEPSDPDDAS